MKFDLLRIAIALTALMISGGSALAADEKADADLKKLEGKWTAPGAQGGITTYTFKANKLKIEAPSRSYEITVKLDAAAKPDKTIDFVIDEAPDDAKGKTSKGIYKFDGDDKFVFCFSGEGDRPSKYEQVGFEQIVIKLERAKK
jgi:uncharacterized protein (TIGR03067 family)